MKPAVAKATALEPSYVKSNEKAVVDADVVPGMTASAICVAVAPFSPLNTAAPSFRSILPPSRLPKYPQ